MSSFTTFVRVEPRTSDGDLEAGLSARVYDPAWLLARQWQLGEFMGEDAGTPVSVRLRAERSRLTRYFPDAAAVSARAGVAFDGSVAPLESLVEREPVHSRPTWSALHRAEAGLEFIRLLRAANLESYAAAYVAEHPFDRPTTAAERLELDAPGLRYVELMADRVPDGAALLASLRGPVRSGAGTLPAAPPVDAGDQPRMLALAKRWVAWVEQLYSEPGREASAWEADRLEYGFAVSAPSGEKNDLVLEAAEYAGGSLDWYAFAERRGAKLPAVRRGPVPEPLVRTLLPSPLRFRGMPNARWWELEEGDVDFGRVDGAPADLARMLLLEFMLVYGNDHFVLPIQLDVGSVCVTRSLVVTDAFGVRLHVLPSSRTTLGVPGWTMFSLSSHGPARTASVVGDGNLFLLPPVVGQLLASPVIEEVLFARDEMANMVWGVERRVEGDTGEAYDRAEEDRWRTENGAAASGRPDMEAALRYRLETTVPANWFPLVPVRKGSALFLKRGVMEQASGAVEQPRGMLLGAMDLVYEEEIPREGIRVTRDYQYTRWVDGSTHLWIGRRKSVGKGEGSSGLRYDQAERPEQPPP